MVIVAIALNVMSWRRYYISMPRSRLCSSLQGLARLTAAIRRFHSVRTRLRCLASTYQIYGGDKPISTATRVGNDYNLRNFDNAEVTMSAQRLQRHKTLSAMNFGLERDDGITSWLKFHIRSHLRWRLDFQCTCHIMRLRRLCRCVMTSLNYCLTGKALHPWRAPPRSFVRMLKYKRIVNTLKWYPRKGY